MRKKFNNLVIVTIISIVSVLSMVVPVNAQSRGGYSQHDVTVTSGLSAYNIERLLPYNMKDLANSLYDIEHSSNPINALFLISIMRLETGNGTHYNYRYKNNVGGIKLNGRTASFRSKESSLNYMHSFLNRGYINQNRRSVWRIGSKYCVGGNWSSQVHSMAKSMMYKIPYLESGKK